MGYPHINGWPLSGPYREPRGWDDPPEEKEEPEEWIPKRIVISEKRGHIMGTSAYDYLEQRITWAELRIHAASIGLGQAIHDRMERDADHIERITGRRPEWSEKGSNHVR